MNRNTKIGLGILGGLVAIVAITYYVSRSSHVTPPADENTYQTETPDTSSSSADLSVPSDQAPSTQQFVGAGCYVGGCSGEVCSDKPGATSSCIYQDFFACFKTARCEKQADNTCGWTPTTQLIECTKGDK